MKNLVFKDMHSLVEAVRNHGEIFPEHMDRGKALKKVAAYYDGVYKVRRFTGKMRLLKTLAVKIPAVRKKIAYKAAMDIMEIYPQSRCDAYIKDFKEDISANGDNYIKAYELLDGDSKVEYLDLLLARLTGDFAYILPHSRTSRQYFSNKIKWKKHPNVVDCGAFIGDTFLSFYSMGIIPSHYFLYELDDANYKKLLVNTRDKSSRVHPRKKGVYSENTIFYYEAREDSSRLVSYETENKVEVVTIDSDVSVAPDFIKMDIEGGEVQALIGGSNTIKKYHPTLAVCIYHLKDDFWKIPLLIHEICPDYNHYWIEHYSPGYNETVLFVSL